MERIPIRIEQHADADFVTIEGARWSCDLFRTLSTRSLGTTLRLDQREHDGAIILTIIGEGNYG